MVESQGNDLDTFVYEPPSTTLPVWYVEEGLVGEEALLSHFQPGRGAAVAWRAGFPTLLLMMDEKDLQFPEGYAKDDFVIQGLYAVFNCCTHMCCQTGWHFVPRESQRKDLGYDTLYCPGHSSQYDPRRLAEYQHPGGLFGGGEGATYLGIYKVPKVGPAKRGMPLIPLELDGDRIVGRLKDPDWYRYKKFKRKI